MNRHAQFIIQEIELARDEYRLSLAQALAEYRAAKAKADQDSVQFAHPEQEIDRQMRIAQPKARAVIDAAGQKLSKTILKQTKELRGQLMDTLTQPVSAEYARKLRFYSEYSITPSRTEAEALRLEAGTNVAAHRALAATLVKTGAPIRLRTLDIEQLEDDLYHLEHSALVVAHVPAFRADDLATGTELYKTIPHVEFTRAGKPYTNGAMMEFADLNGSRGELESAIGRLTAHDAWTADVSTEFEEAADRKMLEKETRRAEIEAEVMEREPVYPDRPESTVVLEEDGASVAREIGRDLAAANAKAAEGKTIYGK